MSNTYTVKGYTIHRLLNVMVNKPDKELPEKSKEKLRTHLEILLVLSMDACSIIRSKEPTAVEQNTRQYTYTTINTSVGFRVACQWSYYLGTPTS